MKKILCVLALCTSYAHGIAEKWIEHTYHNKTDHPVKIITYYTQVVQTFVQPKKRRKVVFKKVEHTAPNTLAPYESRNVTLKGDPLSPRRLVPGSIKVVDVLEHDHGIIPKHNVQERADFIITRNHKDRLTIKMQR